MPAQDVRCLPAHARLGFQPDPTGPFEAEPRHGVRDDGTAHGYFAAEREIKFKKNRGFLLPATSYADHYPAKVPAAAAAHPEDPLQPLQFSATTEYRDEFPRKAATDNGVADDAGLPAAQAPVTHPFMGVTTYSQHYTPWPTRSDGRAAPRPAVTPLDPSAVIADGFTTTHRTFHDDKGARPRNVDTSQGALRRVPWLGPDTGTTHALHDPKAVPLLKQVPQAALGDGPRLDGESEYRSEFLGECIPDRLAPMTGVMDLPGPREALGVQYLDHGVPTHICPMIPAIWSAPCTATQIFTTTHDNQETGAILIRYGNSSDIARTRVLGQFDLNCIPPAPKETPRIEVTFHLTSDCTLHVAVRDLDTSRHKDWKQRGGITLRHPGAHQKM